MEVCWIECNFDSDWEVVHFSITKWYTFGLPYTERISEFVNSGDKFQQYLMTLMDFAKKGCYEYENEIRLTRQTLEAPEYRLSENFIVPYVDNVFPKKIIKKIIIGPCNDFERSTKSLQGWLHKIGMDHVQVTYSMLPYRNS